MLWSTNMSTADAPFCQRIRCITIILQHIHTVYLYISYPFYLKSEQRERGDSLSSITKIKDLSIFVQYSEYYDRRHLEYGSQVRLLFYLILSFLYKKHKCTSLRSNPKNRVILFTLWYVILSAELYIYIYINTHIYIQLLLLYFLCPAVNINTFIPNYN